MDPSLKNYGVEEIQHLVEWYGRTKKLFNQAILVQYEAFRIFVLEKSIHEH